MRAVKRIDPYMGMGYPIPDPKDTKKQQIEYRKTLSKCATDMNMPKCVKEDVIKSLKYEAETDLKRNKWMQANPQPMMRPTIGLYNPYPNNPVKSPTQQELQAHQILVEDYYNNLRKKFPPYKYAQCTKDWQKNERLKKLKNQLDYEEWYQEKHGGQNRFRKRNYSPVMLEEPVSNIAGPTSEKFHQPSRNQYLPVAPPVPKPTRPQLPNPIPVEFQEYSILPYDGPQREMPHRLEKCGGFEERLKDVGFPKATKSECVERCVGMGTKRWYAKNKNMSLSEYIKHLKEEIKSATGIEKQRLSANLWNAVQRDCEQKRLYKHLCGRYKREVEKTQLQKLLPFAIGGLALFIWLD